jgi:O-methyltransferase involved in polyketide biosynthesis
MLASTPEGTVSYVDADLRDVTAVLAGLARTLDLQRPVALIMLGVLGHLDDHGAGRSITSQLMDALPSGSYLAIADGVADPGPVSEAQRRYNDAAPVPYYLRRPDELASFFDGLDLIEPGVVPCPRWKPDTSGHGAAEESHAYCGVARKR